MNRHERRHQPKATKRSYWWIWVVAIVVVGGGLFWINANKGSGVDYSQYSYADSAFEKPNATHLVEDFSDFECPHCQTLSPTIKALREVPSIRVEYRHFPLRSIHPNAQAAAEASECAREQGKFWAYHDVLFETLKFDKRSLRQHAEGLGLNAEQWQTCMDEGRTKSVITEDMLDGQSRGVQGTPAVFLDGKSFSGRSVTDFLAAIQ